MWSDQANCHQELSEGEILQQNQKTYSGHIVKTVICSNSAHSFIWWKEAVYTGGTIKLNYKAKLQSKSQHYGQTNDKTKCQATQ